MLAAQGYCVIQIDSRGSQHRGLRFESHLRGKMVGFYNYSAIRDRIGNLVLRLTLGIRSCVGYYRVIGSSRSFGMVSGNVEFHRHESHRSKWLVVRRISEYYGVGQISAYFQTSHCRRSRDVVVVVRYRIHRTIYGSAAT